VPGDPYPIDDDLVIWLKNLPYAPGAAFGLSQSLGVERLQKGQYQERY